MGETTSISWTNHTFNPWWGCTKVSAGCDNCYAEAFDKRVGGSHWGKDQPRRTFGQKHWNEPIAWDRKAREAGRHETVFCASMADIMDDEAPKGERERLWRLIDKTPNLIWQLLTKRPQRYERYLPAKFFHRNVWLGTTTEDQENYDLRWPVLAAVSYMAGLLPWISYEPALGPITMLNFARRPDWIIFGGESGANRRPCERVWADKLLRECRDTGAAFFVKQFSARTPELGKQLIPADLLIQEFPKLPADNPTLEPTHKSTEAP